MNPTFFQTPDGQTYDLKLDFALAKRLSQWDFSTASAIPFQIMTPAKINFSAIYYDYGLLGAIAFAIVWEREKLLHPEKNFTMEEQFAREQAFAAALDGETLDAMQKALWASFIDFFRPLASDLRKLSLATETAQIESVRMEAEIAGLIREEANRKLQIARAELAKAGS